MRLSVPHSTRWASDATFRPLDNHGLRKWRSGSQPGQISPPRFGGSVAGSSEFKHRVALAIEALLGQ